MIEEIDHWIGKIIQRLEDAGELDNTMIIYTSDHGEMLGKKLTERSALYCVRGSSEGVKTSCWLHEI